MFMVWLMEQEDRQDAVGDLRTLLFADYNNGCMPQVSSAKSVVVHFLDKHPNQFILFRDLLAEAIKAYEDPLAV
jgi:hypothetical protein